MAPTDGSVPERLLVCDMYRRPTWWYLTMRGGETVIVAKGRNPVPVSLSEYVLPDSHIFAIKRKGAPRRWFVRDAAMLIERTPQRIAKEFRKHKTPFDPFLLEQAGKKAAEARRKKCRTPRWRLPEQVCIRVTDTGASLSVKHESKVLKLKARGCTHCLLLGFAEKGSLSPKVIMGIMQTLAREKQEPAYKPSTKPGHFVRNANRQLSRLLREHLPDIPEAIFQFKDDHGTYSAILPVNR